MSLGIMSLAFLGASPTVARTIIRQQSLEHELEARGIIVIPDHLVQAHKRAELAKIRHWSLNYVSAVLVALESLCFMLSTLAFAQWVDSKVQREMLFPWTIAVVLGGILSFGLAVFGAGPLSVIPAIPILGLGIAACLHLPLLFIGGIRMHDKLFAHWELNILNESSVPVSVSKLAKRVASIPGSRIRVESLQADPFLVIMCGWGPFRQMARIAAWNTGDPYLDSFSG